MRMILTALAIVCLSGPAAAQKCLYFNQNGQSLDYRPTLGEVTWDPLYDDAVACAFIGQPTSGNKYELACGDGPRSLVIGASEPNKPFSDILVFSDVFYWLKCEETT
jgi:hypothetical protein